MGEGLSGANNGNVCGKVLCYNIVRLKNRGLYLEEANIFYPALERILCYEYA